MDEMKVKLSTKFMRGLVSKLIARHIRKKYGLKVDIQLNELAVSVVDGDTQINTNVEIKLNSKEFMKIMQHLDEE